MRARADCGYGCVGCGTPCSRIRAAIDVTDPEPLPEGHRCGAVPNLLLTPHVGGSSPQFAPRALRIAADELRR